MGNRLRKLRQRTKGLGDKSKAKTLQHTTADGKVRKETLKAKEKLTDVAIDRLQNYFGIALRSGATTVADLASFFHLASSKGNEYHAYCPATKDSWCQFKRDEINGTNLYKLGKGFEAEIIKHVKLEYVKLTDEAELLSVYTVRHKMPMKVLMHSFGNVLQKVDTAACRN